MISQDRSTRRRARLVAWLLAPVVGVVASLAFVAPAQAKSPCQVTYRLYYTWSQEDPWDPETTPPPSGFVATVSINNVGTQNFVGWRAQLTLDEGVTVVQAWNAEFSVTHPWSNFDNAAWNGYVRAGASVSFGFRANVTDPATPTVPTRIGCSMVLESP